VGWVGPASSGKKKVKKGSRLQLLDEKGIPCRKKREKSQRNPLSIGFK